MSKLPRKNANRELSALARLSDRDIDTSEIPEIKDWSRAILARFYKASQQRAFPLPLTSTLTSDLLVELGSANVQSANTTRITEVTSGEVVKACINGIPEAWSEFIRRFHRLIATVVMQTSRQWGVQSPQHLDDLVQEVYLRLCADDYRVLRRYQGDYASSFFSYLKVIATKVVHDQRRPLASDKRGSAQVPLESNAALVVFNIASPQEKEVLEEEIDRILKTIASENERASFWLYYRDGFSAAEIAALPTVNLTIKGVEILLHRLTSRIRSELTKRNPKPHSS